MSRPCAKPVKKGATDPFLLFSHSVENILSAFPPLSPFSIHFRTLNIENFFNAPHLHIPCCGCCRHRRLLPPPPPSASSSPCRQASYEVPAHQSSSTRGHGDKLLQDLTQTNSPKSHIPRFPGSSVGSDIMTFQFNCHPDIQSKDSIRLNVLITTDSWIFH